MPEATQLLRDRAGDSQPRGEHMASEPHSCSGLSPAPPNPSPGKVSSPSRAFPLLREGDGGAKTSLTSKRPRAGGSEAEENAWKSHVRCSSARPPPILPGPLTGASPRWVPRSPGKRCVTTQNIFVFWVFLFVGLFLTLAKDFPLLFSESGRVERHREWLPATHIPSGPGVRTYNPGTCPRPGVEPATLQGAGRHSNHWAMPGSRAICF